MNDDSIGKLCKTDKFIMHYGNNMFSKMKGKKDKYSQIRNTIKQDMRRLGHLIQEAKRVRNETEIGTDVSSISADDFVTRENFQFLQEAINRCTMTDDIKMKASLKIAMFYLIKKFAKVVKATFLTKADDAKAEEVEKFLHVFNLHQGSIIGEAEYKIHQNRSD